MNPAITAAQMKRLQVLYTQYERSSLDASPGRAGRLAWASEATGRPIASFKDFTRPEAIALIDWLQKLLNVNVPNKSPRPERSRRERQKMGTEGRRDQAHAETTLAGPAEFAMIQRDLDRLGWTQARLDAFLASPRNPIDRRTVVRTLGDANRVHWALKHIKPDSDRQIAS